MRYFRHGPLTFWVALLLSVIALVVIGLLAGKHTPTHASSRHPVSPGVLVPDAGTVADTRALVAKVAGEVASGSRDLPRDATRLAEFADAAGETAHDPATGKTLHRLADHAAALAATPAIPHTARLSALAQVERDADELVTSAGR